MFQCWKSSELPSAEHEEGQQSSSFKKELEKALKSRHQQYSQQTYLKSPEINSRNTEGPAGDVRREIPTFSPRVSSTNLARTRRLVLPPLPPSVIIDGGSHALLVRPVENLSNGLMPENKDDSVPQELIAEGSIINESPNLPSELTISISSNDNIDSVNIDQMPTAMSAVQVIPETEGECSSELQKDEKHMGDCIICYSQMRDHVMVPCGHLYCTGCAQQQLETGACFICSREVIMVVKVFT